MLFPDDPDFTRHTQILKQLDGNLVDAEFLNGLAQLDLLRVNLIPIVVKGFGDLLSRHRSEQVTFLIRPMQK